MREQDVYISVAGEMDRMNAKGYIAGPVLLSDSGWKRFLELEAEGFNPTSEEIATAVDQILDGIAERN